MRTIAHISDLHFGREDPRVVEGLLEDLEELAPSLVAVSGDLTQRARTSQFHAARRFLDRLPSPWLAVPGNHDIPAWDLFARFVDPLGGFRRIVSSSVDPIHVDEELAVLGLNTARSLAFKEGRISVLQMESMAAHLTDLPPRLFRVVVTHHPFLPPPGSPRTPIVGRALRALEVLEDGGIDLVLTGHLHRGFTGDVREFHAGGKRSILVAQAGTTVSRRHRGEPNAYNHLQLEPGRVRITVRMWDGARFAPASTVNCTRENGIWIRRVESGIPPPSIRPSC